MKKLFLITVFCFIAGIAFSATEDFTTFTEQDDDSHITVASSSLTTAGYTPTYNYNGYVYKDYGAGHFDDFEHDFKICGTNMDGYANASVLLWGIGDTADATYDDWSNGIFVSWSRPELAYLISIGENGVIEDSYSASSETDYYLTVNRTGTTLTCYIYSDALRETLLDTLTTTVATTAWRYLYGMSFRTIDAGGNLDPGACIEDLDLKEGVTPTSHRRTLMGTGR